MGATFSQFFPPAASLTEANLPPQTDKVFLITGGASGIGYELARILYYAGGAVYIAGRSKSNALASIEKCKSSPPPSSSSSPKPGSLTFLYLDLADLSTIKPFVSAFQAQQGHLHVLFNNAGVSLPPQGSVSKQNHELQLATNCLGPYLLTQLLLPILSATASTSAPATTRVIWTSSQIVDLTAAKGGGWDPAAPTASTDQSKNYTLSKVGNWFLASELAGRVRAQGILSITQNPGNLKTNLLRHAPTMMRWLSAPLLHDAKMGAYTALWAGLSPDLGLDASGGYVVPWGRMHPRPRADLVLALKSQEEGGTGRARAFAEWCEVQVREFS